MTPEEKLILDLRDFRRVRSGIETYSTLGSGRAMLRLLEHEEDVFCEVSDHPRTGKQQCTRDGYFAITEIAERHRDSMTVPDNFSVEELADGIRARIVAAMVDCHNDHSALERVLSDAVSAAEKNHIKRTYHFPCVIVPYGEPEQFLMGPVTFTASQAFPRIFAREFKEYVDQSIDKTDGERSVERFAQYVRQFGWLGSVTIPPAAKEAAKGRAELAVATAINLLRLILGVGHGRDMRVAHTAFSQPSYSEYAVTENGEFDLTWSRRSSGALVEKDWYLFIQKENAFWKFAERLLATTVQGKRSEMSYRVQDALTWFGDSAFESQRGIQIVNFVAALERITTTESFSTHKFCSRVAMLANSGETDFEGSYWKAFEVHTARSRVIHGGFSPASPAFSKIVRIAHDLTRTVLFRGLELHSFLEDQGKTGDVADLQSFFTKWQSKWAAVLKKLQAELKAKKTIGF